MGTPNSPLRGPHPLIKATPYVFAALKEAHTEWKHRKRRWFSVPLLKETSSSVEINHETDWLMFSPVKTWDLQIRYFHAFVRQPEGVMKMVCCTALHIFPWHVLIQYINTYNSYNCYKKISSSQMVTPDSIISGLEWRSNLYCSHKNIKTFQQPLQGN